MTFVKRNRISSLLEFFEGFSKQLHMVDVVDIVNLNF